MYVAGLDSVPAYCTSFASVLQRRRSKSRYLLSRASHPDDDIWEPFESFSTDKENRRRC